MTPPTSSSMTNELSSINFREELLRNLLIAGELCPNHQRGNLPTDKISYESLSVVAGRRQNVRFVQKAAAAPEAMTSALPPTPDISRAAPADAIGEKPTSMISISAFPHKGELACTRRGLALSSRYRGKCAWRGYALHRSRPCLIRHVAPWLHAGNGPAAGPVLDAFAAVMLTGRFHQV